MRTLLAAALAVLSLGACDKEPRGPSKGPADFSQPKRVATTGTGEGAGATHHRDDGRALATDLSQHAPDSTVPRAMTEMTGAAVLREWRRVELDDETRARVGRLDPHRAAERLHL